MPTVLRVGAYRFYFYSGDRNEPEHVHVRLANNGAKFWLNPVRLERSQGLDRRELGVIERIVIDHQDALLERWHDYFQG